MSEPDGRGADIAVQAALANIARENARYDELRARAGNLVAANGLTFGLFASAISSGDLTCLPWWFLAGSAASAVASIVLCVLILKPIKGEGGEGPALRLSAKAFRGADDPVEALVAHDRDIHERNSGLLAGPMEMLTCAVGLFGVSVLSAVVAVLITFHP